MPPDATIAKLEELLGEEEKKVAETKRLKEQLDQELGRRQGRRAEIPGRIRELQELQTALDIELKATPAGTGPKAEALVARTTAKILAAASEIKAAQREVAAYAATTDLLPLEHDLASRAVSFAEKRVAAWRQAVEDRRAEEVQRQAEMARLEAATATGPLRPLAGRSAELAKRSGELLDKIQTGERRAGRMRNRCSNARSNSPN